MEGRLELYSGIAGLDRLAPDWQRLCRTLPEASFAHSWEWHRSFLENLAAREDEAFYGVLRGDGGEIAAIIPLFRSAATIAGIPCRVFKLPTHEHMPYSDVIATPEFARSIPVRDLLDQLHACAGDFDALVLGPVLERSAATELIRTEDILTATERAGHSDALRAVPLDQMLARLSGIFRSNLRRGRKKLERLAGMHVACARRPEELAAAFPHFLQLEASGWKGVGGTGTAIALDASLRNFYGQLVERLGDAGCCEIHHLDVGDVPIAAQLGVVFGRRYYQLKIGYDEKWAHLAPGNALLEYVVDGYASHPTVKYVDLVSGARWHEHWNPEVRQLVQRFAFRPSARGRLAWATLHGKQAIRPVRKLLARRLSALRAPTATKPA